VARPGAPPGPPAVVVAAGVYGMPAGLIAGAVTYGAAFGLFPIGWVVFSAILLYRVTLETGGQAPLRVALEEIRKASLKFEW